MSARAPGAVGPAKPERGRTHSRAPGNAGYVELQIRILLRSDQHRGLRAVIRGGLQGPCPRISVGTERDGAAPRCRRRRCCGRSGCRRRRSCWRRRRGWRRRGCRRRRGRSCWRRSSRCRRCWCGRGRRGRSSRRRCCGSSSCSRGGRCRRRGSCRWGRSRCGCEGRRWRRCCCRSRSSRGCDISNGQQRPLPGRRLLASRIFNLRGRRLVLVCDPPALICRSAYPGLHSRRHIEMHTVKRNKRHSIGDRRPCATRRLVAPGDS